MKTRRNAGYHLYFSRYFGENLSTAPFCFWSLLGVWYDRTVVGWNWSLNLRSTRNVDTRNLKTRDRTTRVNWINKLLHSFDIITRTVKLHRRNRNRPMYRIDSLIRWSVPTSIFIFRTRKNFNVCFLFIVYTEDQRVYFLRLCYYLVRFVSKRKFTATSFFDVRLARNNETIYLRYAIRRYRKN